MPKSFWHLYICIFEKCSTWLGSPNCSYDFSLQDFKYTKKNKQKQTHCFSVQAVWTHNKVALKAEFINRKHTNLTDIVLVLKLLILQVKQVFYRTTDYQLSNEMSDQTGHNLYTDFSGSKQWIRTVSGFWQSLLICVQRMPRKNVTVPDSRVTHTVAMITVCLQLHHNRTLKKKKQHRECYHLEWPICCYSSKYLV